MTEAMGEDWLAEIRDGRIDDQDAVVMLLAEVERLRTEGDLVTVMRGYVTNLRRGAYMLAVCFIAGAVIWNVISRLVGQPWTWPVAMVGGIGTGGVIGMCRALIEDRWDHRNG